MISIIIITYNRCDQLKLLLTDFTRQLQVYKSQRNCELIIIDNNSTDGTEQVVSALQAEFNCPLGYFYEAKQGSSSARNRAIKEASGDSLVFLDDDVRLSLDWFEKVCACITVKKARAEEFAFGTRVIADWQKPVPSWLDLEKVIASVFPSHDFGDEVQIYPFKWGARTVSNPITANFVCSKSLFEKHGDFNESLGIHGETRGACEDSEFMWRLISQGQKITYEPSIRVHHPVPESRMTKSFIRNWYKLLGKTIYQLKAQGLDHLNFTKEPLLLVNIKTILKAFCFLLLWLLYAFDAKQRFYFSVQCYKALGEIEGMNQWQS